jgi:hypothetical protein
MAIDLISVPTATWEVADITGDVLPDDDRTTDRLKAYLANNAVVNVADWYLASDGANYDAAFTRALAARNAKGPGTFLVPEGTFPTAATIEIDAILLLDERRHPCGALRHRRTRRERWR